MTNCLSLRYFLLIISSASGSFITACKQFSRLLAALLAYLMASPHCCTAKQTVSGSDCKRWLAHRNARPFFCTARRTNWVWSRMLCQALRSSKAFLSSTMLATRSCQRNLLGMLDKTLCRFFKSHFATSKAQCTDSSDWLAWLAWFVWLAGWLVAIVARPKSFGWFGWFGWLKQENR